MDHLSNLEENFESEIQSQGWQITGDDRSHVCRVFRQEFMKFSAPDSFK